MNGVFQQSARLIRIHHDTTMTLINMVQDLLSRSHSRLSVTRVLHETLMEGWTFLQVDQTPRMERLGRCTGNGPENAIHNSGCT
jgi:hypothetical protein